MKTMALKRQRCAIYTRKSTEHNLDVTFTSLDAQREACEAYIKSQAHEGWTLVRDRFDDGGLSGASLDRPALQSLLDQIRARRVDIIVVYKVDRLTRSLADFAKLVELFDEHEVAFVSVTQSFNTTSSMGRLTLNVLLSFAQFEREVIDERVRDKIAASKRKGISVGGPFPLGYRSVGRKLEIVSDEADHVRKIFAEYLRAGSIGALAMSLNVEGLKLKPRQLANGRLLQAPCYRVGPLAHLLKNRSARWFTAARGIKVNTSRFSTWICSRPAAPQGPADREIEASTFVARASRWQNIRRPERSNDADARQQARSTLSYYTKGHAD